MLAPVLFALLGSATPAVAPDVAVPPQALRIWLNRQGTFDRGDKVRVYTRAADDGYLFVLHVEPNGRVRVLFPLDPLDDNFIRAGQDYEIRGRGDREAFQVYETEGAGTVFATLSPDPFRFDGLVLNAHWDYRAADWNMTGDPEADLVALVGRFGGGRFEYDVVRYVVGNYVAYGGGDDWYQPALYDPYFGGHSWYGGSGFSINVGFRFGHGYRRHFYDPWYWDPWYWDPWWYPSPCWSWCYNSFYYAPVYYGYPSYYGPDRYGYGYGYVTPGAVGRGYTFKSADDRFGLAPNSVGSRRRTLASGTPGSAGSPTRTSASPARRTPSATPTRETAPDARATPGRRTAGQPSTGTPTSPRPAEPRATPERRGSAGPSRTAAPANPPASRPPASPGRRQVSQTESESESTPPAGERLEDGSYRLPTPPRRTVAATPETESARPVGTLERRAETEPRRTLSGADRPASIAPRGLTVANDASAPRRSTEDDEAGSSSGASTRGAVPSRTPTSVREVEPRSVPTPSRATPSNGSVGRRTPSSGAAPSSGRTPSTRSAPSPSSRAPAARPAPRAPTRSAPSRSSGSGPSRRSR